MAILPPAMQKAFTCFGSSMTCTSHFQLAESGRKRTACAIRRSVISRTRCARGVSVSTCFFLDRPPIMLVYAEAELLMALDSETTISWLRPVIGLVEHAASAAPMLKARMREILMGGILRRCNVLRCNCLFSTGSRGAPRNEIAAAFPYTFPVPRNPEMPNPDPSSKKLPSEPRFEIPPQWMHESVAGLLGQRREARKRAVIRLLDRLPLKRK
jgi:hypothetical protein